jgi:squalene-associated FAD-dependent desaturase
VANVALRVAIVGAGYAGMAAAVTLAAGGARITVFEAAAVPGGRARRIVSHGESLDNGQHVLIGAYTELLGLMRKVGVPSEALLRIPLELQYARGFRFRALWLPPPIGIAGGLLCARGVPFGERLGALRFLHALRRQGFRVSPDRSVASLLEHHGQRGTIGRYLWEPLCVSALNTPVEQASANAFLAVMRDTLAGGEGAADLLLPRRDLSQLFPEPAVEFVRRHGGEVRLRSPVSGLDELKRTFDAVIVAVGPHQLKTVLPPAAAVRRTYQPIYTCYLQYEERFNLPFPMVGLSGGLVQWVFDRGALLGERGRLACVISADGRHRDLALDELAARCAEDVAQAFPAAAKPHWSRAIAEKRATIACTPDRPRAPLEHDGIVLAGDYTDPEYPPTLEAAVRSGVRAAQRLMKMAVKAA